MNKLAYVLRGIFRNLRITGPAEFDRAILTSKAAGLELNQVTTATLATMSPSVEGTFVYVTDGTSGLYYSDGTQWLALLGGAAAGTVTSVGVVGTNGISSVNGPITAAGNITIGLGNITPSSVAAVGAVTGSNLSGTNTGDQTITLTGPVTGTGTGTFATTITPTAVTPGTYTSANITVGSDGRLTFAQSGPGDVLPSYVSDHVGTLSKGMVVCLVGGMLKRATNASPYNVPIGLLYEDTLAQGVAGRVQTDLNLTTTTLAWDAATGMVGGLSQNQTYYLGPSGAMTPYAPSTNYVVPVGVALNSTTFRIGFNLTILR